MVSSAQGLVSLSNYDDLERTLTKLVERIRDQGQRRRSVAAVLRRLKHNLDLSEMVDEAEREIAEDRLVTGVDRDPLSSSAVMGVDGGVLGRSLHGFDLILVRAVAAVFRYSGGELSGSGYYPSELPTPRLISIDEPLDSRELELAVGMQRQLAELQVARDALGEHEVDAVLLDGSVVPQYVDRFPHSPRVLNLYRELIDAFTGLYRACAEAGALLAGAVKDSRSSRFINLFQRKILPLIADGEELSPRDLRALRDNEDVLPNSRDTALLDHLLDVGERSFSFSYADPPAKVLEDLGEWATRAYAFYIKTVPYDYPLRVEFVGGSEEAPQVADRVASLVYALSANHDACALPTVLIEADACARLAEEELTIIRDNITDRLEHSASLELRRQRRPF
jgi:hypothetical protein